MAAVPVAPAGDVVARSALEAHWTTPMDTLPGKNSAARPLSIMWLRMLTVPSTGNSKEHNFCGRSARRQDGRRRRPITDSPPSRTARPAAIQDSTLDTTSRVRVIPATFTKVASSPCHRAARKRHLLTTQPPGHANKQINAQIVRLNPHRTVREPWASARRISHPDDLLYALSRTMRGGGDVLGSTTGDSTHARRRCARM